MTAACISRGTELPTELPPQRVRRLVDEDHPMRDQPFVGGGAIVGEGADDLAVVVAVVGKAVRFDHRPIGQVAEQQVGRVLDAVLLLRAGAAAQRNVAAAGDRVAADILLRLDARSPTRRPRAPRWPRGAPWRRQPITTTSASPLQLLMGVAGCAEPGVGAASAPGATAVPAAVAFRKKARREKVDLPAISGLPEPGPSQRPCWLVGHPVSLAQFRRQFGSRP